MIALVWDDVVNESGSSHPAYGLTPYAQRMFTLEARCCLRPPVVIATLGGASTPSIVVLLYLLP